MSTSSEDKAAEAKPAAPAIHLDRIVGIVLDTATVPRYHNELHVLDAWFPGLQFLYSQVRLMEQYATKGWDEMSGVRGSVPTPPAELVFGIGGLACCYQWYAVTLCNFVELIGAIGWELDKSRKPPREYIKEVIPAVLQYRNKVGAHVGRARKNAANPAEQLLSLLPPTALVNGRFTAGSWATHIRRSGTTSNGQMLQWSLTTTHEELAERYWPNLFTS